MMYFIIGAVIIFLMFAILKLISAFKNECRCIYHQTNIQKSDPLFGGRELFICENCHHELWVHVDEVERIFAVQREMERLNMPLDEVFLRK